MIKIFKHLSWISFDIAWAGVILLAPVTSLPLLSILAGGSQVAPASFIPLCWLLVFWFVLYIIEKGSLPRETVPFIVFISVAITASAFGFFINIPSFKGVGIAREEAKAILTLLIGASFYFIASSWLLKMPGRLEPTLKMINVGGGIMLFWALCQGTIIYIFQGNYPRFFLQFQALFSNHGFFQTRMVGFAYEPSWLAQGLNLFYLPFWLAASSTGYSVFKWRVWKFRVENFLLVIGVCVLFLSSRVGTLSFIAILAFLGGYFSFLLAKRLQVRGVKRFIHLSSFKLNMLKMLINISILTGFVGIFVMSALFLLNLLSQMDPRLAAFFQVTSLARFKEVTTNIFTLFNYLQFGERFVFWVAGWNIFNMYPILGVGLGNAGFFFPNALPAFGWVLPEITNYLYIFPFLPNIKSLWIRLLAETGIAGFSTFITWCYVLLGSGKSLLRSKLPVNKTVGWFGTFVLIALIFEGFSTDTFALPYFWISMGILSGVAAYVRCL